MITSVIYHNYNLQVLSSCVVAPFYHHYQPTIPTIEGSKLYNCSLRQISRKTSLLKSFLFLKCCIFTWSHDYFFENLDSLLCTQVTLISFASTISQKSQTGNVTSYYECVCKPEYCSGQVALCELVRTMELFRVYYENKDSNEQGENAGCYTEYLVWTLWSEV